MHPSEVIFLEGTLRARAALRKTASRGRRVGGSRETRCEAHAVVQGGGDELLDQVFGRHR